MKADLTAISSGEPRRLVLCGTTVMRDRSRSLKATLTTRTGRVLPATPKSRSQISPGEESPSSSRNAHGIEGQRAAQHLVGKDASFRSSRNRVGSCLDIAATILRPLQAYHGDVFDVAPYTVLLDPELAERVFTGHADPDVTYLFKNQLAEADILCLNKRDRYPDRLNLPVPVEMSLSAMTGEGIGEWLARVLEPGAPAGTRLLDVDYERYADAEAALGG